MPDPDLSSFVEEFLIYLTALGRAPATITARRLWLRDALKFLATQGVIVPTDVTSERLDQFVQYLRDRGLAQASIQVATASVCVFTRWLHLRELVPHDPGIGLEWDRGDGAVLPDAPLSEQQVAALIDAIPARDVRDLRNRAHLELMYGCGLRLSETIDAELECVDLRTSTILVRGKFGHERLLPIMPQVLDALAAYLPLRRTLLRGPDPGWLFLHLDGGRIPVECFRQWLRALGRRILPGVRVHPHALRHAAAVHLLRGGADIRHVQEFLGHAHLDTTKTYLRLIPGHLRADYDDAMPVLADLEDGVP